MKANKKLVLLTIFIIFCIISCGEVAPIHTVIDNKNNMIIYAQKERKDLIYGRYEYWIRDNSTKGWTLITDKKFYVGDVIEITTTNNIIKDGK